MTPEQQEYKETLKYWRTYWLTHDPKEWKGDKLNWHHDQAASFWPDVVKHPGLMWTLGDSEYCKKAAAMAKSDKIMKHRDDPDNLVPVPYPVHYRLHELYPKFTEGSAHHKMLKALGLFKDGNGLVLTSEQYEAQQEARIKSLLGNTYSRDQKRPTISAALKKNHPSHNKKHDGPRQVGIVWGGMECLFVTAPIDVEQRVFGPHPKRRRGRGGAAMCNCDWFKEEADQVVTIQCQNEPEAFALRDELDKKLEPKYKGQFRYNHLRKQERIT